MRCDLLPCASPRKLCTYFGGRRATVSYKTRRSECTHRFDVFFFFFFFFLRCVRQRISLTKQALLWSAIDIVLGQPRIFPVPFSMMFFIIGRRMTVSVSSSFPLPLGYWPFQPQSLPLSAAPYIPCDYSPHILASLRPLLTDPASIYIYIKGHALTSGRRAPLRALRGHPAPRPKPSNSSISTSSPRPFI